MRSGVMGCEGNNIIKTPNLDQLAVEGVRFENAFVTTSICCTSRVNILTGQYSCKHGILDFKTPLSEEAFSQTYPMILKDYGYRTGFIGKYGIGKSTDEVEDKFDFFYGSADQPRYENYDEQGNYIHYTDIVESKIEDFLETTNASEPFCLSVSFKAPHVQDGDVRQFIYNPRFKHLYENDSIPPEPTNNDEVWNAFPEYFKENNEARNRWKLRFSDNAQYQESVRGYYRLITGLDEVIGNVRKLLKEKKLSQNTIIVFFSDNGFYLGEKGLAGKWYGHEPSIRVPFIIYDPSRETMSGTVLSQMVLSIDIAPTILSFAGINAPAGMQGEDLEPLMKNQSNSNIREAFYYSHLIRQFDFLKPTEGVRGERYKYLVYPDSEPLMEEFYDLKKDPNELNNLIGEKEYGKEIEAIKEKFKTLKQEACR
jgi:arylsulfatase A-like enzyme